MRAFVSSHVLRDGADAVEVGENRHGNDLCQGKNTLPVSPSAQCAGNRHAKHSVQRTAILRVVDALLEEAILAQIGVAKVKLELQGITSSERIDPQPITRPE